LSQGIDSKTRLLIIKNTAKIILYYQKNQASLRNAMKIFPIIWEEGNQENYSQVHQLVFETVRFQNIINRLIHLYIQKRINFKIPTYIRDLLRVVTYILISDTYRTDSEWIQACKQIIDNIKHPQLNNLSTNFISNLLDWDKDSYLLLIQDNEERMGVEFAHPTWLVRDYISFYGLETTKRILQSGNLNLPLYLRLNLLHYDKSEILEILSSEEVEFKSDPDLNDVIKVLSWKIPIPRIDSFKNNLYYIQNKGSALISHIIDPKPHELILDACAAPGGKTTHLATLQRDSGRIIAIDNNKRRMKELKTKIELFNLKSIDPLISDLRIRPNFRSRFDKILVDAPCSGSGTFSSRPDSKWRIDRHQTKWLSDLQYTLLSNVSTVLKENSESFIIYSTCSLHPLENEYVIQRFLQNFPNFELKPQHIIIGVPSPKFPLAQRLFPHITQTDGFSIFKLGWKV